MDRNTDPTVTLVPTPMPNRIAELVSAASDGAITAAEALEGDPSLLGLGLGSLGFLRLVDALESEYRVEVDLDEGFSSLDRISLLVGRLAELGVGEAGKVPR
jgi:acyl carrier protein